MDEAQAKQELDDLTLAPSDMPCLHLVSPSMLAGAPGCKALARRLFKAIDWHKGWGLAAPQLGVAADMAVINIPEAKLRFCLVNPVIKRLFGQYTVQVERCLSLPGVQAVKMRHEMIDVIFQDEHGKMHHVITGGLLSRVLQHEIAHLRGTLITDGAIKAAPLRSVPDEPQPETQPVDGDRLPENEREVGQADVAPSVPAQDAPSNAERPGASA